MNKAELHIIVLWANAKFRQDKIIEDVKKNLDIIDCFEIEWSKEFTANNFTRFYGQKLESGSFKEIECGTGSFILMTVMDKNPNYDFAETSRGYEYVNTNIFNLKQKYRQWTDGGHKIHATNNIEETNHDITLLLGINYSDYVAQIQSLWNGQIKKIKRNLAGCGGWKNLEELFYVLNSITQYCVLRNGEILPNQYTSDLHGDIDILTDDYHNMRYILNGNEVFQDEFRVQNKTVIANQEVLFDIRYLGDNYYCEEFEKKLLNQRVLSPNGVYVLSDENYFYSLIYHCLIHKKKIAKDYYKKVYDLFVKIGLDKQNNLNNWEHPFDLYFKLLIEYMKKNGYNFIKPNDLSVIFNKQLLNFEEDIAYLKEKFFLTDVCPFRVGEYNGGGSGYIYYTAKFNDKKLFIKYGGIGQSAQNEFFALKKLCKINNRNFVQPFFYRYEPKHKFIAIEYIKGMSLQKLINENTLSLEQQDSIVEQLEDIATDLLATDTIHRDIRPDNLILTEEGNLVLIDMQFVNSIKNYKESDYLKQHSEIFSNLGDEYALAPYKWDDMYSIAKLMRIFNRSSRFVNNNIGLHTVKFKKKQPFPIKKLLTAIFSVKNEYKQGHKYKVIRILGIKIKFGK